MTPELRAAYALVADDVARRMQRAIDEKKPNDYCAQLGTVWGFVNGMLGPDAKPWPLRVG